MYFDTTEKVIDRRLSLNSWNYGVCLATLGASGVLANWAISGGSFRLAVLAAIALLSAMGGLLCWFWIGQLRDLKLLNGAKFAILEQMAPLVYFAGGEVSYEPFRREWEILTRQGATTHRRGLRIRVLKSSNAEFLLPTVFMVTFGIIMTLLVALCAFNGGELRKDMLTIPAAKSRAAAQ